MKTSNTSRPMRSIKSIIGMSREKFDELVPNFSTAYQKIQEDKVSKPKKLNDFRKAGNRAFFRVTKNTYFLFYTTSKPIRPSIVLGFDFGLIVGQAHDYIELFLRVLEHALTDLDQLPEVTLETPEDLSQLVDQYDDIILMGSRWLV